MKKLSFFIVFLLPFLVYKSFAYDATIEIVKQEQKKPLLYIQAQTNTSTARKIKDIMTADLRISSHFNIASNNSKDLDLLAELKVDTNSDDKLFATVTLINIKDNKNIYAKTYEVLSKSQYPFLAHRASIDINSYIKAPSIEWMGRYIIFEKYIGPKQSEIVVADYTLAYQKSVVKGGLNIFPKWANKEQTEFYYTSYNDTMPTLYKLNIQNNEKEKIFESQGMIVCSDVSKNDENILITMVPDDTTQIYLYNLLTKKLEKITSYDGTNVNGSFLKGDKKIVFVSNRLGYPTLFEQSVDNPSVVKIVYGRKSITSITTNGNYIIYSSRDKTSPILGDSVYNLYLISLDSNYVRQLTTTGRNYMPVFSPSGDVVLYIKKYGSQASIGIISLYENTSYLLPIRNMQIMSIDW